MKLFGYKEGNDGCASLLPLSEASMLTSPAELRAIAKVLADLAVEMEADDFDHVHLIDRLASLRGGPNLIVFKAR